MKSIALILSSFLFSNIVFAETPIQSLSRQEIYTKLTQTIWCTKSGGQKFGHFESHTRKFHPDGTFKAHIQTDHPMKPQVAKCQSWCLHEVDKMRMQRTPM